MSPSTSTRIPAVARAQDGSGLLDAPSGASCHARRGGASDEVRLRAAGGTDGGDEIGAELVGVAAGAVAWRVALDAPALGEGAGVDGVEAERVEERRHGLLLPSRVIARDHQRATVPACRAASRVVSSFA